jgi:hypothetical protein
MQTTCCYALQDKAWVNDPDGNEWEVFTVIEDNLGETESKAEGGEVCCAPAGATVVASAVHDVKCGCETAAPAEGKGACCDTQAKAFDIEVEAGSTCCA